MGIRKLDNPFLHIDGYNCFGCGPHNETGLRMEFCLDDETGEIFATTEPRSEHCGYPGVLHGGIQASMLDEVAYWAIFHETGKPALTVRIEVDFKRAVVLPAEIEVRAMVTDRRRCRIAVEARLMVHGETHALARIVYLLTDPEKWQRIAGTGVSSLA